MSQIKSEGKSPITLPTTLQTTPQSISQSNLQQSYQPLAAKIRPTSLDEYIGQSHLVGPNKPLRVAIEKHQIFSMIFWGPPGVGKTSLAKILAHAVNADFLELSAVSAGKADVREIIDKATISGKRTI